MHEGWLGWTQHVEQLLPSKLMCYPWRIGAIGGIDAAWTDSTMRVMVLIILSKSANGLTGRAVRFLRTISGLFVDYRYVLFLVTQKFTSHLMDWQDALEQYFPSALPVTHMASGVDKLLQRNGFDPLTTRLAMSICPDELNRSVTSFNNTWGPPFHLGGLAGFPFTGQSGFDIYTTHIPEDGTAFLVYASHVGITDDGVLGRVQREGQESTTASCWSVVDAYEHLLNGGAVEEMDGQQQTVTAQVKENWDRLEQSEEPLATLPAIIYEEIREDIYALISPEFSHKIALLGGLQINTSPGNEDYFVPRDFQVVVPAQQKSTSLLEELRKQTSRGS